MHFSLKALAMLEHCLMFKQFKLWLCMFIDYFGCCNLYIMQFNFSLLAADVTNNVICNKNIIGGTVKTGIFWYPLLQFQACLD